jgi:hypothetical protein
MDSEQFKQLKNVIHQHSKNLSQPPKKGETNKSQTERELQNIRAKRKKIAEQLVQEGYADSYNDAEVLIDVMSPTILEAISATKATVRALRERGAAQKRMAQEDRKREAERRAEKRKAEREKELEYVQKRRENPEILKKEAQKRTLPTRMERAAKRLGLD